MTCWSEQFRTYEDACIYYGADTPAQLAAELEMDRQAEWIDTQDSLEAHGGASARSHAIGQEHVAWCRGMGYDLSDDTLVSIVLWGRAEVQRVSLPVAGFDDGIPF